MVRIAIFKHNCFVQSSTNKKCKNMKTNQSILKVAFLFIAMLVYGFGNAQNCCSKKMADCPKKETADCPLIKDCPKKGTADCPLIKSDNTTASKELANCPLAGTPECPLIKNCLKKGTADCPYANANKTTGTASITKDEDLPPCCKKKKAGTN